MSVLIASKYWIHYLSVPKEPPWKANGSRINWLVQGSPCQSWFCYCAIYLSICKTGESTCFKTRLFLHSTYQHITLLFTDFCIVSDITATFQQLGNAVTKSTRLNWEQLRNFVTKVLDFSFCFWGFFFFNLMLICRDGDITWECTPLQEVLTRKGLSSTGIWRDISTPD